MRPVRLQLFYVGFCYSQSLTFRPFHSPGHLRLRPLISPRQSALLFRCCCRCRRIWFFFSIASHPMARFTVSRLHHPRHGDGVSFSVAFISTVCHCWIIFASSTALDPAVLLWPRLCRLCSPPLVLRSPSPLPLSPHFDCTDPPCVVAYFRSLLSPVIIYGRLLGPCFCLSIPRTLFQGFYPEFSPGSALGLIFWRCKHVSSWGLP